MSKMTFTSYLEAKENFAKVSMDQEATPEQKTEALNEMMDALQKETRANILQEARATSEDNAILQSRGQNVLTSEERKFFNEVIEDGGFKEEDTLPVTVQERIFEGLTEEHPFLTHIGLQNLGAVTEFIYSDPEGSAVWRVLFGEIQGQLNTSFRKEKITQMALTAFWAIHNDMLELGPEWVERYVRTCLIEAIKVGLEYGFIQGRGLTYEEPIGLFYEEQENGAIVEKESAGKLTFEPGRKTITELRDVVKLLAKKLNADGTDADRPKRIAGKVVMVTNPFDTFDIQANATTLNANGVYVTSLPFNPIQTESVFVPEGKVLFFVKGEYIAATGGPLRVKKFDQTLAFEDATLYTAKQFATGKPKDKYAAQVYDLDVFYDKEEPEDPEGA